MNLRPRKTSFLSFRLTTFPQKSQFPFINQAIGFGLASCGLFFLGGITVTFGQTITNPSFESPSQAPYPYGYYTAPLGSIDPATGIAGWIFGSSDGAISFDGLLTNTSGFISDLSIPQNIPDGSQVAFIQGTGSISQNISGFSPGSYAFSLYAIPRSAGFGPNPLTVTIDSTTLNFTTGATLNPTDSTQFLLFTSDPFAATAGSHTLTLTGTISGSTADRMTIIDNLSISAVPEPSSYAALLGLIALGFVAYFRRHGLADGLRFRQL